MVRFLVIKNINKIFTKIKYQLKKIQGFPGDPVVKNPPPTAGDTALIPGWGTKITHARGQLSPYAATTMLILQSLCSATREATAMRRPCSATGEKPLLPATRESPCIAMKTKYNQKRKKTEKVKKNFF